MAEDHLAVYLNERRIGELSRIKGGRLQLAYDADYRGTPLSYSMPTQTRVHSDPVVAAYLWNLLPDNPRLLASWGRQYHVDPSSCYALLGEIGEDCAGAVRFLKPEQEAEPPAGGLAPISNGEIAKRLALLETDPAAARSLADKGRFSLAGAQAKIALRLEGRKWSLPWGSEPTTHILKPPRSDFAGIHENEHFCLTLAARLGMRVAETSVLEFQGQKAFVTKRFDRLARDGKLVRIHQEDMCQALGVGPDRKYESDRGPGAAAIMNLLSGSSRRIEDRKAFLDALLFNYLILGTDAHAKNYSIQHARGEFILAPLYDIASFAPYATTRKGERLAMRIDRYYKVDQIRRRHFERLAISCNFSAKRLLDRLEAMSVALPDHCQANADALKRQGIRSDFVDSLAESIAGHAERCRALLFA